jgi:hypothetical protein
MEFSTLVKLLWTCEKIRILVGKPERKRPLERLSCRWEDNIEMYLRDIEWARMDWIYLAQDKE